MPSITLSELRESARQRADMSGSQFVTDAELNAYVNTSIAELRDIQIGKYGEDYFVSAQSVSWSANVTSSALPSDYHKTLGVDLREGASGDFVALKRFNFSERNRTSAANYPGNAVASVDYRYRVIGDSLYLTPAPSSALTVKHWYVPTPTYLTGANDSFNFRSGWEEFVIVDCAIKCLQKEESDVSVLMAQKAALTRRIEESAANRDAGEPQRVNAGTWDQHGDW